MKKINKKKYRKSTEEMAYATEGKYYDGFKVKPIFKKRHKVVAGLLFLFSISNIYAEKYSIQGVIHFSDISIANIVGGYLINKSSLTWDDRANKSFVSISTYTGITSTFTMVLNYVINQEIDRNEMETK